MLHKLSITMLGTKWLTRLVSQHVVTVTRSAVVFIFACILFHFPLHKVSADTSAVAPNGKLATILKKANVDVLDSHNVQLTLEGDGYFLFRIFELTNPRRLVFELPSIYISSGQQTYITADTLIFNRISVSQYMIQPMVVRAVIEMNKPIKHTVIPENGKLRILLMDAEWANSATNSNRIEIAASDLSPLESNSGTGSSSQGPRSSTVALLRQGNSSTQPDSGNVELAASNLEPSQKKARQQTESNESLDADISWVQRGIGPANIKGLNIRTKAKEYERQTGREDVKALGAYSAIPWNNSTQELSINLKRNLSESLSIQTNSHITHKGTLWKSREVYSFRPTLVYKPNRKNQFSLYGGEQFNKNEESKINAIQYLGLSYSRKIANSRLVLNYRFDEQKGSTRRMYKAGYVLPIKDSGKIKFDYSFEDSQGSTRQTYKLGYAVPLTEEGWISFGMSYSPQRYKNQFVSVLIDEDEYIEMAHIKTKWGFSTAASFNLVENFSLLPIYSYYTSLSNSSSEAESGHYALLYLGYNW